MAEQGTAHFGVIIDYSQTRRDAKEVEKIFEEIGKSARAQSEKIDSIFDGLDIGSSPALQNLERLVNDLFGNMSEKARQLATDIQEDILTLSQLEKAQHALNASYEAGKVPLDKYLQTQARLSVLHDELSRSITENERVLRESIVSTEQAGDSIAALQTRIALLTTEYMRLSQAQREGAAGTALLKNLTDVQNQLKAATASMDQYARSAGTKFNGLNWQVQQLVRELPSLAFGPQMFFLAISNNLPMFADELKKARQEMAAMNNTGGKGVPVWKQLASSLLSWQTALVGGVTLLTLYGNEIVEWVGNLFSGKNALDAETAALETLNGVMSRGAENAQEEVVRLELLYGAATDAAKSYDERRKAAEKLQDIYPHYFENMNAEQIMLGQAVDKYNDLSEAIVRTAQAQAAYDEIVALQRKKSAITSSEAYAEYKKYYDLVQRGVEDRQEVLITTGGGTLYSGMKTEYQMVDQNLERMVNFRNKLIEELKIGNQDLVKSIRKAGGEPEEFLGLLERQIGILEDMATLSLTEPAPGSAEGGDRAARVVQQAARAEINAAKSAYDETTKLKRKQITDKIKLIEFDRDQTIAAIEAEKEAYIDLQIEAGKAASREDVDVSAFDTRMAAVNAGAQFDIDAEQGKRDDKEKKELNNLLREVETYEQRRMRIQEEYAEKRKKFYDEDGALREGVTQGNLEELDRDEREALEAVDEEFASREATYQAWMNRISAYTLEELKRVLLQAEQELEDLEKQNPHDPSLAQARSKASKLRGLIDKKTAENESVGPGKRSVEEWNDLREALDDAAGAFDEIGKSVGGLAGEIISTAGNVISGTVNMINGITQLTSASAKGMAATATAAGESMSAVEKASVILAIITTALQIAMKIAQLFDGDKKKEESIERLQGDLDRLRWEQSNTDAMRLEKNTGDSVERVRKAYVAARHEVAKVPMTIDELITKNNAAAQAAEKLSDSYGNISYTADKALGLEKYEAVKDELNNIAEQQVVLQRQLELEKSKKNPDPERVREIEQQIAENAADAAEEVNNAVEDILGGSAESIANKLGNALFEAFKEGTDAAQAWGQTVDEIIRDIVKRMLISEILEKPIGEAINRFQAKVFKDGKFQGTAALEEAIEGFNTELDNAYSYGSQVLERMKVSPYFQGMEEVNPSKKGIAQASQDSVDELNGRATAIQEYVYSINATTRALTHTAGQILRAVVHIEGHTDSMETRMGRMEENLRAVNQTMSDIAVKGIKVR